jgi:hypothetical protein
LRENRRPLVPLTQEDCRHLRSDRNASIAARVLPA